MTGMNLETQDINLTRLKQPPIHILTQTQPHGVVLVLQEPELTVLQVSRNTSSAFGIAPEKLLGKTLDDILDSVQVDRLRMGLSRENLDLINPTKVWVRRKGDDYLVFDAVFHRSADGFLVLELEPALTQENIPFLSFYHLAKASINQLEGTSNLRDFGQIIVREVRNVTGFDRVMLYKFDDDGHGEVIAEEKLDEMEPYLGCTIRSRISRNLPERCSSPTGFELSRMLTLSQLSFILPTTRSQISRPT
jgi:chemotaxis family two-component system sensor kinase Cph1